MWVKVKVAGPKGSIRRWAIPYRGFLIVRHASRFYTVTHAPSGRALPASAWDGSTGLGTTLEARMLIQCIHFMPRLGSNFGHNFPPGPVDPSLPMKEFKARYGDLVREAVQGFTFGCGPDIEEAQAKLVAAHRARKGLDCPVSSGNTEGGQA